MRPFVKRDLDGFFGLFIDNLVQLLLIVGLCGGLCGMAGPQAWLIYARILPGAAVSLLFGNLFYAWQAHRVARREGRNDVTALPYGINTPSLIVYMSGGRSRIARRQTRVAAFGRPCWGVGAILG